MGLLFDPEVMFVWSTIRLAIGFVVALIVGKALLRVGRSVSNGLQQAAIEVDASLLLLGWPGPADIRARMVGATYSEIIAATSVPVAIAALHPGTDRGRVVLFSAARQLVPGNRPTMALALELASTLSRERGHELVIGPVASSELETAGLTIPEMAEHRPGPLDLGAWASNATAPGDLIVVPIHDPSIGQAAISVHGAGRSVLAVSQNPTTSAASSALGPMTLPVGSTLGA